MFIPTILSQGSAEQQALWLPRCYSLQIIGTYAQTELAHGTFVRGLETTATYDQQVRAWGALAAAVLGRAGLPAGPQPRALIIAQRWKAGKGVGGGGGRSPGPSPRPSPAARCSPHSSALPAPPCGVPLVAGNIGANLLTPPPPPLDRNRRRSLCCTRPR
jgi:hypothetical protein